jgi:hypothetical protein
MERRNGEDSSEKLAICSNQLFVLAKSQPKCTTAALQTSALLARAIAKGYLLCVDLGEDVGEVLWET